MSNLSAVPFLKLLQRYCRSSETAAYDADAEATK